MSLPAALTWTCLFPADAAFECSNVPDALRTLSSPGPARDGPRVWVADAQDIGRRDGAEYDGVVGIGRGAPSSLRDRFDYVREFAVVPSWDRPRWFIPLDNRHVAAGSFSLFKPVRRFASIQHAMARQLAKWNLPICRGNRLVIASRKAPVLERAMRLAAPDREFRIALSSGSAEGVRNRKVSFALVGLEGEVLSFGKMSGSALSEKLVRREAQMLRTLQGTPVESCVPRVLFAGDVDGRAVTVSSPLAGSAPTPFVSDSHVELLARFETPETRPASESGLLKEIIRRAEFLERFPRELSGALDSVMPVLERLRVPRTIVHRDFTPWNLRIREGRLLAFDWEYGHEDGLPLLDRFHHELAVGFLLKRWNPSHAIATMSAFTHPDYSQEAVRALQVVYLVDYASRLLEEGYPPDFPKLRWWLDVLDGLMKESSRRSTIPRPFITQPVEAGA